MLGFVGVFGLVGVLGLVGVFGLVGVLGFGVFVVGVFVVGVFVFARSRPVAAPHLAIPELRQELPGRSTLL